MNNDHEKLQNWMISSHSWHFILYEIAVAMWCKWTGRNSWQYERVNLCTYIRMILLWFPLMTVILIGILSSPIWILSIMTYWYGTGPVVSALWSSFMFIGGVFLALLCFIGIIWFFSLLKKSHPIETVNVFLYRIRSINKKDESSSIEPIPENKNFFEIFVQWISDHHNMICRPITVVSENKEVSK